MIILKLILKYLLFTESGRQMTKQKMWEWTKRSLGPFLLKVLEDSIKKSIEMEVQAQVKKALDK